MTTERSTFGSLETDSLTRLHWLGVVLAVVTGIVHLVFGFMAVPSPLGVSFVLAGLGFFGAVVLLLVDYRRRLLYLVGIPFTAVQVVLFFVLNWPNLGPGGIADKVVQLALIVVLVRLYQQS